MERSLPQQVPVGFTLSRQGVPNVTTSKPYFSTAAEAVNRCVGDPNCVGVSAQRLFYKGTYGSSLTLVPGRPGEDACFVRKQ